MAIPTQFYQPWAEIDPSLQHGGLPGELGEFVGPMLGDNPKTQNQDIRTIFNAIQMSVASISRGPGANVEGPPRRNIVEETLRALNWVLERILDRTKTNASSMFQWEHATPPYEPFGLVPIRYPLRSEFASMVGHYMIGSLVECAELNANAYHSNLDPNSAQRLLAPLMHMKSLIVKDWFDLEVSGDVSLSELQAMMASVKRRGPVIVPTGESQDRPDSAAVQEALSGIELLQWYPQEEDWAIFGDKSAQIYHAERIWQPEGASATTEDVAAHNPIPATGGFPSGTVG